MEKRTAYKISAQKSQTEDGPWETRSKSWCY